MKEGEPRHENINEDEKLFQPYPETRDTFVTEKPARWMTYKTTAEKLDCERRLPIEIQPFIREYGKKYKEESKALQQEPLGEYLDHAQEAWREHLEANALIDQFLSYEAKNVFGDWSPEEWKLARRLLQAGMETDHRKAVYSAGIKARLEAELPQLVEKYTPVLEGDVRTAITTPGGATFYEGRLEDHRKYALSVLEGEPDAALKAKLLETYHAGDEQLLEHRLREFRFSNDAEVLRVETEEAQKNFRERAAKKSYLTLERQDLKDFEALLHFDNTTEYEYTYSLKGLPDLFLREEILKRLIKRGHLAEGTSVFALSWNNFAQAIDKEIARLDRHFLIHLRPYRQTLDTCGTACVMSVLNRKGVSMNQETELEIWERVGKPYNFPGGLSLVLLKNGFNVTYVQQWPELLRKDNPEFSNMGSELRVAAQTYVQLHEEAVGQGLHYQVQDWDFRRVMNEVSKGNPCILYIYVTETMSHCVVARGYRNKRLEIIDPLGDIKFLDEQQMNKLIDTPMGKRMIVVKKLPNDFFERFDQELNEVGY